MLLLEAMAHQEGFYSSDPNVRPRRNNNPLDLRWNSESKTFGATHGDKPPVGDPSDYQGYSGFAVFPDIETGWQAGRRWLSVPAKIVNGKLEGGYLGATLAQVIGRFAPPNKNKTGAYLSEVCKLTGFSSTDILTSDLLQVPSV